jgi:NAD(P)-dependent dehydrogenase (short-subunit alcohol dehydrogenase family)
MTEATGTVDDDRRRGGDRLAGKVALVVGGGSTGDYPGTGSAMARLFAAQGCRVGVVGRSEEHTRKTVDEITAAGHEAIAVLGDTTARDECERTVATVVEHFGPIDVLVNNVAVHKFVTVDDFDDEVWTEILDGNFKAPLLMTHFVAPHMRGRGGSIINIGSVAGLQASGSIGYGTAKGALHTLTRDMAMALGPDGIRVNCVIPGHLHTPHVPRTGAGEEFRQLRVDLNMLGIEGNGWDAAWAALFFATDESRFVTAQSLVVDAGVTSVLGFVQAMRTRPR